MKRILVMSLAVIGLLFMCGPIQADLNSGLVAYYPFNGNANDESGNGNDGTVNGAIVTTDRFGNADSAYGFGGDDNIICNAFENHIWGSNISISVWFKKDVTPVQYQGIVNTGYWIEGSWEIRMGSENNGTVLYGMVNTDDSSLSDYSATSSADEWHHVVLSYDGNQTRLFLNGILQVKMDGSTTDSGDILSKGKALMIGQNGNNSQYFHGSIDDIRIYNRALSATEVKQLYWGGGTTTSDPTTGCSQTELDAQYQAGYSAGLAAAGGSSGASITINPDFSFNIPSAIYSNPLTGSMDLNVTFDYFGDQGGNMLWKLGPVKQN